MLLTDYIKDTGILADIDISIYEKKHETKICGTWAVLSICEKELHRFAKVIYCGKEWCPVCGAHRSASHNRKIARILPKAMQIKKMGYFVIEFPDVYRLLGALGINPDSPEDNFWCYSKRDLKETTNIIVGVLGGKRSNKIWRNKGYFKRGLVRWHWFGDRIPGKYNPHLNVLVDGAYIKGKALNKIKDDLKTALNCPDLIVNYSYCDEPGQKFHKVEYITRATFLDKNWNQYMAEQIFNYRNQRWWGKWHDEPVWALEPSEEKEIGDLYKASLLQKCKCPECNDGTVMKRMYNSLTGKTTMWTRPVDCAWLIIWGGYEYAGTGYMLIKPGNYGPRGPDRVLTDCDIIDYDQDERNKYESEVVNGNE